MANNNSSELTVSNLGLWAPNQGIVTAVVNTGNSNITLDKAAQWVQVVVLQKHFTAGNGTTAPVYGVDTDTDGNYTFGNVARVANQSTQRATGPSGCVMIGAAATGATKYWRIVQTMSGTDTAVYEYKLTAIG